MNLLIYPLRKLCIILYPKLRNIPRPEKACTQGLTFCHRSKIAYQSQQLYRHESLLFSPLRPGLGSQKYVSYIPQKSRHPRLGYNNGGAISPSGAMDGRIIIKELLTTKRMSISGIMNLIAAVENDFYGETVTGTPCILTTERVKKKVEEFDRSIPDPEDRHDMVRVEAEIYLVVLENASPNELTVIRDPTSLSCTVL